MLDIAILYILLSGPQNIYSVRKLILSLFAIYIKPSFGSLHPAMKRLESAGYVKCENTVTMGGQPKSTFTITVEGKKHFSELLKEEFPANIAQAKQMCDMKLLMLSSTDESEKDIVIYRAISFHEKYRLNILKVKDAFQTKNLNTEKKLLEYEAESILQKITWLKSLL